VTLIINSLGNTLTYTAGFLTGSGTFARWFATAAISGNAGCFQWVLEVTIGHLPLAVHRLQVVLSRFQYNDASTVSAITFMELAQNYVNRYDANWVVTPSGSYEDPAMTLTIHGDGNTWNYQRCRFGFMCCNGYRYWCLGCTIRLNVSASLNSKWTYAGHNSNQSFLHCIKKYISSSRRTRFLHRACRQEQCRTCVEHGDGSQQTMGLRLKERFTAD